MLHLSSIVLGVMLSTTAQATESQQVDVQLWTPQPGDTVTIDTENNMGYIFRADKSQFTSFRVVTGQLRNVYYIGRYYYAKTPDRQWEVQRIDTKGDRVTFGPTGRFLRLYDEDRRTSYGIHGHRDANVMLADDMRYRSMGCIIVRESVLDLIEQIYLNNGETLQVTTMNEAPLIQPEEQAAVPEARHSRMTVPKPTWF